MVQRKERTIFRNLFRFTSGGDRIHEVKYVAYLKNYRFVVFFAMF